MADKIDIVATRILVDAQDALKSLNEFDKHVAGTATRMEKLKLAISRTAASTGKSVDEIVKSMQKINAPGAKGQIGSLGFNNAQIKKAGEAVKQANDYAAALERATTENKKFNAEQEKLRSLQNTVPAFIKSTFGNVNAYIAQSSDKVRAWKDVISRTMESTGGSVEAVGAQLKKMVSGTSIAPLNQAIKEMGGNFEAASKKSKYSIDVIKSALGVLTSMIVFELLNAIVQFSKKAVQSFTEVEDALWRIHAAEVSISKMGTEVTFSGLTEGIGKVKEDLKIFSQSDLLKGASDIAVSLGQLGFSEQQILSLTRAAAVLNVVSTQVEDYSQTVDKINTAMLSGTTKGVSELSLAMGENAIQSKAMQMGLLAAGESVSALSQREKNLVKLQIVLDTAAEKEKLYNEYLKTNSAKLKENSAAYEDLATAWGGFVTSITPGMTSLLNFLTGAVSSFKAFASIWVATFDTLIFNITRFDDILSKHGIDRIKELIKTIVNIPTTWKTIFDFEIKSSFGDILPADAPMWLKALVGGQKVSETPTAKVPINIETEGEDKAAADLEKLKDKLIEVARDAEQARKELEILTRQKYDDIVINANIKIQDLELEFKQKLEDAERDLQQAIEDIHIDTQQKIEDAQRKYREDELRAELEFQQKLKELRNQFLMDLEDALHARDARQVLRLIKQYNFEKQQLADRKKLEDQLRAEALKADLEAIRIEEQRRIEAARLEYQRKLEEINLWKDREFQTIQEWQKREFEELALWKQRESEEINRDAQNKIESLAAELEGVNEMTMAAINAMIANYSSASTTAMNDMYSYVLGIYNQIEQLYLSAMSMASQMGASLNTNEGTNNPEDRGYAEGGTLIATRPTKALFGEAGPELVTFTPLGRTGRDVNKLFGDVSALAGGQSTTRIELILSPDLQTRVVDQALNRTAEVITRVARTK